MRFRAYGTGLYREEGEEGGGEEGNGVRAWRERGGRERHGMEGEAGEREWAVHDWQNIIFVAVVLLQLLMMPCLLLSGDVSVINCCRLLAFGEDRKLFYISIPSLDCFITHFTFANNLQCL